MYGCEIPGALNFRETCDERIFSFVRAVIPFLVLVGIGLKSLRRVNTSLEPDSFFLPEVV